MSDKEKNIIKKLKETIPLLTEYQRGYLLGMLECMADNPSRNNRNSR